MTFQVADRLVVNRKLMNGSKIQVGTLAQNSQGVFFQYESDYLKKCGSISPFKLKTDMSVQLALKSPHDGLHGVFSDSLPDGWGLLLQDRAFRKHGIQPRLVTMLDRLAFVGNRAIGALSYAPASKYGKSNQDNIDLLSLGLNAQSFFDGQTEEVLSALTAAGSSGGARPKAQIYTSDEQFQTCRTTEKAGDDAWIVKFTSKNLALGHEEGLCEAVYLHLAEKAMLQPPDWTLLDAPIQSGAQKWLALKRFDVIKNATGESGRLHMHSACGLLGADFRLPSLDYDELIRMTRVLCKSPAAGQLQFKRAIFNLITCNQDDHSKNWAFLQNDAGQWEPAPFYDITFSPTPYGEHSTAYSGYGKHPSLSAIQTLSESAGYSNWDVAKRDIADIVHVVSEFDMIAKSFGVSKETRGMIRTRIHESIKFAEKNYLFTSKS